jgi:hypothetical protein
LEVQFCEADSNRRSSMGTDLDEPKSPTIPDEPKSV